MVTIKLRIENLMFIIGFICMGLLLIPGMVFGAMVFTDTETGVSCSGNWDTGSYTCPNTYDNDPADYYSSDYATCGRASNLNGNKEGEVITNYTNSGGENRLGIVSTQSDGNNDVGGFKPPYFNTTLPLTCVKNSVVSIKHRSRWDEHDITIYCLNETGGWSLIASDIDPSDEGICEIGFYVNQSDDTDYPKYSDLVYPSYIYYSANRSYEFFSDWSDGSGISKVFLEYGGTNYTADASGSTYNVTLRNLSIGSHAYRWIGNDTLNKFNATGTLTYTLLEFIPETISIVEIEDSVILDINATGYILMVLFGSMLLIFIPGAFIIGYFKKK